MEGQNTKAQLRSIACFFAFGYIMVFLSEVVSTALTDMLAGSSLSKKKDGKLFERTTFAAESPAVLITGVFQLLVKLSLPWLAHKVPYLYKAIFLCSLYAAGLALILLPDHPVARLLGVVVFDSAGAAAEVVFLSFTAFFGDFAVNSFVAGGGVSEVVGPLYYAGECLYSNKLERLAYLWSGRFSSKGFK